MKICLVGTGAIGGFLGARLAAAGRAEISALARGAKLDALREHGWRLRQGGILLQAPASQVSDRPEDLGPQDLIVIAVKAPALPGLAASISPLIGARTLIMPAMNGVPWWFGRDVAGLDEAPLASVDPDGSITAALPYRRIIGCVVHASTSMPEPGLVHHNTGQRLILGDPGGGSANARGVAELFAQAGFEVSLSDNIRSDIWYKLWGNMTMNPVSAVTGATIDRVLADPLVLEFCSAAMREAADVGARIGCAVTQTTQDRIAVTRRLGAFKTSMLQDVEAGREIELDALVTVVHEIGRRLRIPTPNIDALLGLTRLFARVHGLYQ